MPPTLALLLWVVLLLSLLFFDPAKDSKTSVALWVPVLWMSIAGSRNPSLWVGAQVGHAVQALEEGNAVDRTIYFGLIFLALSILLARSLRWHDFLAQNLALMAFVSFALVSVCWSDFIFVAFKRWFRDLGDYLVVLVALSDPRPVEAIAMVLRRVSYVLLPLSVLLIKYYPALGTQYSLWTGGEMYVGVTTGKNLLGVLSLIGGLFFLWDTLTRWPMRKRRRSSRIIMVNIVFIVMALWLLKVANSVTSDVCMALGCLTIIAARLQLIRRRPGFFKALIPTLFCLYLIVAFGLGLNGQLAGAVGKDPTLTDRTRIWSLVLRMGTNPLVGAGYESFWLGSRLERFWEVPGMRGINEAHNGYLEIYLNLGLIGVFLAGVFLIVGYRTLWRRSEPLAGIGSLALALWIVFLFFNMAEAGFRMGLMWPTLLLVVIAIPRGVQTRVRKAAAAGNSLVVENSSGVPKKTTFLSAF